MINLMDISSDFGRTNPNDRHTSWRNVLEFSLPAIPGCDVLAVEKISVLLSGYLLRPNRLSKLKESFRDATSIMIEGATLSTSEQMIDFQVHVSDAVAALNTLSDERQAGATPVGWGYFLVQILNGAQSGLKPAETNSLLRLYIYIEGDQAGV
jgi:hypothetical protein